jgi:YegS/Rv2252/BmrU family lipid kinase
MIKKPKKLLFLINPEAGNGKGEIKFNKIKTQLKDHSIDVDMFISDRPGKIKKFIYEEDLTSFDGICTIGGDGTIHEAIDGLMRSGKSKYLPLGVFPGGSGNSFCNDLSIYNDASALTNIIEFTTSPIDIMEIQHLDHINYSANIIGWGMASEVNILAEKLRFLGTIRYSIASLICILRLVPKEMNFIIGDEFVTGKGLLFLALNTMHTGKGMKMAPKAKLNDGLIDIILFRKASKLRVFKIFTEVFSGNHINDPLVEYYQVSKFKIRTSEESLNLDGENKGRTPISVNMLPKSLNIFVNL